MFCLRTVLVLACVCPTTGVAACGKLDSCDSEGEDSSLLQAKLETRPSIAAGASGGPAPLLWASSGGGWRAMMLAVGFANAFESKAKIFSSGLLTNVAANSGGSWFLANFAYNQQFYQEVIYSDLESLKAFSVQLLTAYGTVISQKNSLKASVVALFNKLFAKSNEKKELFNVLAAASGHTWLWRDVIEAMLDVTPGSAPGFYRATTAGTAERKGLQGPTLHFQASQLTDAFVSKRRAYLKDGEVSLADQAGGLPTIPTQYIVSGTIGQEIETGWHYPSSTKYNYYATTVFSPSWLRDITVPVAALPASPNIGYVAAASSAVLGQFGGPTLRQQSGIPIEVDFFNPGAGLQGLAVCGGPLNADGYCDLQYSKLADGGFNDNIATAQSIAVMQGLYGPTHPLKMVLTDAPPFPFNITLEALFNWNESIAPGDFMTGVEYSFSPGIHVTSPQVFNAKWQDLNWTDLNAGCQRPECVGTFRYFRYAEVHTETVDNPAYGVVRGTPINLLIFQASSSTLTDFSFQSEEAYANLTIAIAGSEAGTVFQSWMVG